MSHFFVILLAVPLLIYGASLVTKKKALKLHEKNIDHGIVYFISSLSKQVMRNFEFEKD